MSVALLRGAATIRERCRNIADAVEAGRSTYFMLDLSRLAIAAQEVVEVTRARYPNLSIPYHSRWRHFEAGGVDRASELNAMLANSSQAEQARARIDLTVISVLLDAGAGANWRYHERQSGLTFNRSEGLGVASFRAFMAGVFSAQREAPLRVDATALQRIDASKLAQVFQVASDNPLVGLEGRAQLLRRLGDVLLNDKRHFAGEARPGALFDLLTSDGSTTVPASSILQTLLDALSAIWLTGAQLDHQPLGDVWRHPFAGGQGASAGWVPFHKLSQWLTYSLLEPFEWAGITVNDLDALTGLPEYRNGGLLLDTGVIKPRQNDFAQRQWQVGDEAIVEWRALTVSLLDALAPLVRERLGVTATSMPLARILESGTWAAGRALAQRLRDGAPPLNIVSDGTVF